MAGSTDAWSTNGRPNEVGIVHIIHMGPEIGIMLMCVLARFVWHVMPWPMFFGILCIVLLHILVGMTHWPLRIWMPSWRPNGMQRLSMAEMSIIVPVSLLLLIVGFRLLVVGTI